MTVRLIDQDTGDIATSGQQFLTDREEIAQTIETRLKLFLGEYFRDITDGTPWFDQILGKGGPLQTKEAIIRNRIVRTDGVIRLTSFNTTYTPETRAYNVTAGVLTRFGTVEVSV